jgi:hypothetical protein
MAVFRRTSCCQFRNFQKVAAKSALNRWFIANYTPQTFILWRNIAVQSAFG